MTFVDEIAAKVSKMFDVEVTSEDLIETLNAEESDRNITIIKEIEIERQKLRDKTQEELEIAQRMFSDRADKMAQEDSPIAAISEFYCSTIANEAMALLVEYQQ